jgi:poly(A) polymerase
VARELVPITIDRIDADAVKVVRRLTRHGYQAYLVGGCVRDLLLGRAPKDFDVSTSATPPELRKLFRNCRIIGRRFRLAHIFFGPKIIETATFRASPRPEEELPDDPDDLLIMRDNVFGTAEEDARRRDFTINGLFFDVERGEVIDTVGGLPDLRDRLLRTIGEPQILFQEDPIRIIRAIKFATRLDLTIEAETRAAMIQRRGLIARCSLARALEEVYRLLRSGHAAPALYAMHQTGILPVLLPEVAAILERPELPEAADPVPVLQQHRPRRPAPDVPERGEATDGPRGPLRPIPSIELPVFSEEDRLELLRLAELNEVDDRERASLLFWRLLQALDQLTLVSEQAPEPPLLLATVLDPLLERLIREDRKVSLSAEQVNAVVHRVALRLQVSRRHRERLVQIVVSQRRLVQARPRGAMAQREYFVEAFRLLQLRHLASGGFTDALDRWRSMMVQSQRRPSRRGGRRRRRRERPGVMT